MAFLSVVAEVQTLPHLSSSLTSSICLPIDLKWVWPGVPLQDDYLMCCCAELDQGVCLKRSSVLHLQDHLTQPLPASDPLLTGSPVCQGRKKHKQRGSVHPGAEHRTLFILSPMLLPESTILASGWLYFKIQKYSPSPMRWEHLDAHSFFHWCFNDKPHQRSPKGSKGKTRWIHICLMSSWNSHTSGICLVT